MSDLRYEVVASWNVLDEWRVEAIDYQDEGVCYLTIFSGPDAKERAEAYAVLKNSK